MRDSAADTESPPVLCLYYQEGRPGWLVGRDPQLHHVQGDEPLDLQYHPRRVRHLGRAHEPGAGVDNNSV